MILPIGKKWSLYLDFNWRGFNPLHFNFTLLNINSYLDKTRFTFDCKEFGITFCNLSFIGFRVR